MKNRCSSCVMMRMEKEEPETWNRLHMGGGNKTSCQHLQVLVTKSFTGTLGMARGRISHVETHGSVIQPTMFVASLDIKASL